MPTTVTMNGTGASGGDMFLFFPSMNGAAGLGSVIVSGGGTSATGTFTYGGVTYGLRYLGTGLAAVGTTDIAGSVTGIELYDVLDPGTIIQSMTFASHYAMTSAVNLTRWQVFTGQDLINGSVGSDLVFAGSGGNSTMIGGAGNDTFAFAEVTNLAGNVIAGGTSTTPGSAAPGEHNTLRLVGVNGSGSTFDVRGATITDIDTIFLDGPSFNNKFILSQFGTGKIASDTLFINSSGGAVLSIIDDTPAIAKTIDASTFSFIGYSAGVFYPWFSTNSATLTIFHLDASANTAAVNIIGPSIGAWLNGGAGNDTLIGGALDDLLLGSAGSDTLNGGGGSNAAFYATTSFTPTPLTLVPLVVNVVDGSGTVTKASGGTDTISNVDRVVSGDGADLFYASATGRYVYDGAFGNDTLDASAATTPLQIYAGYGNSSTGMPVIPGISAYNIENIFAGSGNDTITASHWGTRIFDGGGGFDKLLYNDVQLGLGDFAAHPVADVARNIERVEVAASSGRIYSNELGNHEFVALGEIYSTRLSYSGGSGGTGLAQPGDFTGNLTFNISAGYDGTVTSAGLNDTYTNFVYLEGGAGNDMFNMNASEFYRLRGGVGSDTLNYATATNDLKITIWPAIFASGSVQKTPVVTSIYDYDSFYSMENFIAGTGNDLFTLRAVDTNRTIDAGAGSDTISFEEGYYFPDLVVDLAANGPTQGRAVSSEPGTITLNNFEHVIGGGNMTGNANANRLEGRGGNDTLIGGAGADTLVGGANTAVGDTASYVTSNAGIVVDLLTNANFGGDAAGDSLSGIENVTGSGQSDILLGGVDANVLEGGGGADFIFGRFGADTIRGGDDGDTLFGDDASGFPDGTPGILYGADSIYGEGGNDNIYGEGGGDFIDGGDGIDTANYSTSTHGISVFLQSGQGFGPTGSYAAGDTFANIENVVGTAFVDQIFGDASANTLEGRDGNDTLAGSLGSDILVGGSGADSFVFSSVSEGGPGGDIITDFTDNTDVLDLRTLFTAHSLSTVNPVGSGVLIVRALGPGSPHTEIAIDLDGSAGGGPAFNIATLLNITPGLLSVGTDILVA